MRNKIIFDEAKVKIVNIDQVGPNDWNPKDQDTEEYLRVKKSIVQNGLRLPIVVRNGTLLDHEIIDGEQRWRVCKELEYDQILIYDEGEVSDKEARQLTIAYQQQVPFNNVDFAKLIKDMNFQYTDIQLPYSPEEIKNILDMLEFEWADDADGSDDSKTASDEWITFTARVPKTAWAVIDAEFKRIGGIMKLKEGLGDAAKKGLILEMICANSSGIPVDSLT